MFCLAPRKLLVQVGLLTVCLPTSATGQVFARAALEAEDASNASCALQSCPPRTLTYGYYHEHWRRWPEEPGATELADELSPFTRPSRGVPAVEVPPPSDEDALAPRRRKSAASTTEAPVAPSGRAAQPTPGGAEPKATRSPLPVPPPPAADDLLDLPDTPSQQPAEPSGSSSGGFFPQAAPQEDGQLPDAGMEPDSVSPLPPTDTNQLPPTDPFNVEPAENGTQQENVFDLDDFGRADPQRLRRYRMSSTTQLRQHGATRSRVAPRTPSTQIQLTAYRQATQQRRNPLRAAHAPESHVQPATMSRSSEWTTEPMELEPVGDVEEPLEWADSAKPVRPIGRRSNPLR
jgi:hypothetical protein